MPGVKEQAVLEERLPMLVGVNIGGIGHIVALPLKPTQQIVFIGREIGEASVRNLGAIKRDRKRTIPHGIWRSVAIEAAPSPGITRLIRQDAALEENWRWTRVIAHDKLGIAHESSRG